MKTQLTKIYAPLLFSILSHLQTPLPAVKTTSWALRSQTLFGWHLSCGCSTWLSEQNLGWQNLGEIQLDFFLGRLDFGRWLFWRNICLGNISFLEEILKVTFWVRGSCIRKNLWGPLGAFRGSLDFWKAWWCDSFTEGCPSPSPTYPSSPQKLCHVLYPFLGKLQYLTNLQFPERREINHQTNFLQNKQNTTNIIPSLFLQNKYIFKF